jgi:hypothetical protein
MQVVRGCPAARVILQVLAHNLPSCKGAATAMIGRRTSTKALFILKIVVFISYSLFFLRLENALARVVVDKISVSRC